MTEIISTIRNAFGNPVELNITSHKEIEALVSELKNKLSAIDIIDGIMLVGSYIDMDCFFKMKNISMQMIGCIVCVFASI